MLNEVLSILEEKNYRLLYLTAFGSYLYGLNTPESDKDYYAIYLQDPDDMILSPYKNIEHYFSFNTKNDSSKKNNSDDIDIKFISLQKFIYNLNNTIVESCDLAYSYTNPFTTIYCEPAMYNIFNYLDKFIDKSKFDSFYSYGKNQVKKYGVKGSVIGTLKFILDFFEKEKICEKCSNLRDLINQYNFIDLLKSKLSPDDGNKIKINKILNKNNIKEDFLYLFSRNHPFNISIYEFKNRIQMIYDRYGLRSKQAMNNENIDWKASMHGIRALWEYNSLITTGEYKFPFVDEQKDILMNIKNQKYSWKEYEDLYNNTVEKLKHDYEEYEVKDYIIDKNDGINAIKDMYALIF